MGNHVNRNPTRSATRAAPWPGHPEHPMEQACAKGACEHPHPMPSPVAPFCDRLPCSTDYPAGNSNPRRSASGPFPDLSPVCTLHDYTVCGSSTTA